jgi:hypothetical protein
VNQEPTCKRRLKLGVTNVIDKDLHEIRKKKRN